MLNIFASIWFSIIFFGLPSLASVSYAQNSPDAADTSLSHWVEFRQLVPKHFQDWIVAGDGPTFTLIYSEPSPAFSHSAYEVLFRKAFRGLIGFQTTSDHLGFNGFYTDIVATLDYSFAGEEAFRELEVDLRGLSHEIYGTSHGARALRLRDLANDPPSQDAGAPVQINASELKRWLFEDGLIFGAPETGNTGTIEALTDERSGRYLSTDGTLVVLIIDQESQVDFSDVKHIRHFVLDSDLILGGVVDIKRGFTIVVGRARQQKWKDFPPLRVEDVLNIIEQKNGSLAQSYDRTTPGAGRVTYERRAHDWAPSYLSAELLNTEFGSLLNEADAILKSQSLANSISYVGFEINAIPGAPFEEGVWDRLSDQLKLTSLVFNFNTLGSGHWLEVDQHTSIYAPNRTGSYSVTYSPFAAGETSMSDEASQVAAAEKAYGSWFNTSHNLMLARAVQYTTLFQIFKEPTKVAFSGYPARNHRFDEVGSALKNSIVSGFRACLPSNHYGNMNFAVLKIAFEKDNNDFPDNKEDLLKLLSKAATHLRYDGNLFGSQNKELQEQYKALSAQREAVLPKAITARENFDNHTEYLKSEYSIETQKVTRTLPNGGRVDEIALVRGFSEWKPQSGQAGRDRRKWHELGSISNREVGYVNEITSKINAIVREIEALDAEWGGQKEIAEFAAKGCDKLANTNNTIFDNYQQWTVENGSEEAANRPFLQTPTIVLSRNVLDPNFLGGHNVERQGLEIASSTTVGSDGFRLEGTKLTIDPKFLSNTAELSEGMAKVQNADPATQRATFETLIKSLSQPDGNRENILKISKNNLSEAATDGLAIHHASNVTIPIPENGLRLGWSERSLYLDQVINGEVRRSNLYGAMFGLPNLLESRMAKSRTATIEFDGSIDAATREELISDFIREKPAAAAGGGGDRGGGNGNWRIASASSGGSGRRSNRTGLGPRLIIFKDTLTKRKRIVVETTRGRIEIAVDKSIKEKELLDALSKQIEDGATLELLPVKIAKDNLGSRISIADFKVHQNSKVGGKIAGLVSRAIQIGNRRITETLSEALKSAFSIVAKSKPESRTNGDLLIEMRSAAMETGHYRDVVGKVVVDKIGLRFILFQDVAPGTDPDEFDDLTFRDM